MDPIQKMALGMHQELYGSDTAISTCYTLNEIRLRPGYSDVMPSDVSLKTRIGPVGLNLPLLSAAMDTVSGSAMARALSEMGGCGIIYRHPEVDTQLDWIEEALNHNWCLVDKPTFLDPTQTLYSAKQIVQEQGFSTIPVLDTEGVLQGILFTDSIALDKHPEDSVRKWMMPLRELKSEHFDTSFDRVRDRLVNEQNCSVLPVLDDDNKLHGLYFMKDVLYVDPAIHNHKPLVGMAIGVGESDRDRVAEAVNLGVGVVVIDSSHGNCKSVIEQAWHVVSIAGDKAAVIAGNVADIDGYLRLADAGVHGVKCGIGSGSICTTSSVTGVGVPMFSLVRELSHARGKLASADAPVIIADGGIDSPGNMTVALAAGAHLCMAGQWLVAATESLSCQKYGVSDNGCVRYRGMASPGAIAERSSNRYGKTKQAPEGVSGYVPHRGPLKTWLHLDRELIQGGCAHVNATSLEDLREHGNTPMAFVRFSGFGHQQINTRVLT